MGPIIATVYQHDTAQNPARPSSEGSAMSAEPWQASYTECVHIYIYVDIYIYIYRYRYRDI